MKKELGISSCVSGYLGGFGEALFAEYEKYGVKYCEVSITNTDSLQKHRIAEDPAAVRDMAARHGVVLWSFHLPFGAKLHPANLDEAEDAAAMAILEKYTRAALDMGVKTVVVHPSSEPNEEKDHAALLQKAAQNLAYLSDICQAAGAVLAVENLPRTCLCNHADDLLYLLRAVPGLQVTFDSNHCSAQSNPDFLQTLLDGGMAGRVATVHLSDYDGGNEKHRLPFDGTNDWAAIARGLEQLGYTGPAMHELSTPWDRPDAITIPQIVENYKELCRVTGW